MKKLKKEIIITFTIITSITILLAIIKFILKILIISIMTTFIYRIIKKTVKIVSNK